MVNQWMTPKDIAAMDGMPGSIQGVHKKAKRDGWPSRKKQGVQGPGIEYLLPAGGREEPANKVTPEKHHESTNEFISIWDALMSRLSPEQRNDLLNHAIIHGVTSLLPNTYSQRALSIAQLIESLSEEDQREILQLIEAKKLGALLDNNPKRKKA
ncbi:hypothetical protein H3H12_12295 [Serratia marcescens]|uniref:DNA-binding protein n=1 Tax=Serratia marcescens TaxID=615 RepID=UPI000760761C|nr:DNA-binding protein [Serratia marcescens]RLO15907.1 hypothetical protein D1220_08500 [Klebsiella pneumoniae]MBE8812468.1 hypothetical protein [Serratia marcescens]MBN3903352.1 hypothetical protein [Serratia marcescens]MBN3912500.1 hypothetical protein [Serratia marcescens]MBN3916600.1 hypothetical protein [Serratia marcescens]